MIAVFGKDQRIVRRAVDLRLQNAQHVADCVAACAVNLRNASQRVGILHAVVVVPVRLPYLRIAHQPPHVCRHVDLPAVGAGIVQPGIVGAVGPFQGFHGKGGNHIGGFGKKYRPVRRKAAVGGHHLRAVDQGKPLLCSKAHRPDPLPLKLRPRRNGCAVAPDQPFPHPRKNKMGKLDQIAGGADRPLPGDNGNNIPVQHVEQRADGSHTNAAVSLDQRVHTQDHHRPHHLGRHRLPGPDRMAANQVCLKALDVVAADHHIRELAEAGGNAVDHLLAFHPVLHKSSGGIHPGQRLLRKRNGYRRIARNSRNVMNAQAPAVKGYRHDSYGFGRYPVVEFCTISGVSSASPISEPGSRKPSGFFRTPLRSARSGQTPLRPATPLPQGRRPRSAAQRSPRHCRPAGCRRR